MSLSWDHLLPKGDPRNDDPEYMVTSCIFCNVADNRYFDLASKRGLHFDGLTPDEPVAQRLPYVEATRQRYREFWTANVGADVAHWKATSRRTLRPAACNLALKSRS